jgi:hypothetical protein
LRRSPDRGRTRSLKAETSGVSPRTAPVCMISPNLGSVLQTLWRWMTLGGILGRVPPAQSNRLSGGC